MRHPGYNPNQHIALVAGAGNVELTARVHLRLLRGALASTGYTVTPPIIPTRFGLGNLQKTYADFEAKIDELRRDDRNRKLLLVGHSLGGLLALRWGAEHPEDATGVITIGAPHGELKDKVPEHYRRAYAQFAHSISPSGLAVACVASRYDELVSVENATLEGAENHILTNLPPVTHNMLPVSSRTLRLATDIASRMLQPALISEAAQPMVLEHLSETA